MEMASGCVYKDCARDCLSQIFQTPSDSLCLKIAQAGPSTDSRMIIPSAARDTKLDKA